MRNPLLVLIGVVATGLGLLFFLQGIGVVTGSTMTNTVTWSVLGPLIAVVGIGLIAVGARSRRPGDTSF